MTCNFGSWFPTLMFCSACVADHHHGIRWTFWPRNSLCGALSNCDFGRKNDFCSAEVGDLLRMFRDTREVGTVGKAPRIVLHVLNVACHWRFVMAFGLSLSWALHKNFVLPVPLGLWLARARWNLCSSKRCGEATPNAVFLGTPFLSGKAWWAKG